MLHDIVVYLGLLTYALTGLIITTVNSLIIFLVYSREGMVNGAYNPQNVARAITSAVYQWLVCAVTLVLVKLPWADIGTFLLSLLN